MNRREAISTMGLGAGALAFSGCGGQAASAKPNIIYILADDLGYGDLACYGNTMISTPNLDRMATEGMRFTQHYAGSTVCAPSRCSLMTGLHTGHTYIRGNSEVQPMGQEPLPPETVTVAEVLKGAGYRTALIGKWGLGGPDSTGIPNRQGFDYFYGYLCQRHAHNYYPAFLFRNEERIPLANVVENDRLDGAGEAIKKVEYSHDLIVQEALDFIDREQDSPFFLYLACTIPHANNEAGERGMEVPSDEPYTNADWPHSQKNKAAMITRMDRDIGTLLARLAELGIDRNTMVIFTSDNGPHREGGADPAFLDSNGPLRGIKRDLYEGGIRVPMIVRWPGTVQEGTESDHISAFWDFLPTAAELGGLDAPEGIDGISFVPEITGRTQPEHDYLYWEFHEGRASTQGVRMGDWKGVRLSPDSPIELYDLSSDLEETTDIATENPEMAERITGIIESARTESAIWNLKTGV